jgi:hypothetical protein
MAVEENELDQRVSDWLEHKKEMERSFKNKSSGKIKDWDAEEQKEQRWNSLPPEYRSHVRASIRVAVHNLLTGEDPTPAASFTTDATPYNAAGLIGILAEPAPVIAVPPRPEGPLAAGMPLDEPGDQDVLGEQDGTAGVADTAPTVARTMLPYVIRRSLRMPTVARRLLSTQAPRLVRHRCVVFSSSAVAFLTLTIVYRRPHRLRAPPMYRWWMTTSVSCQMWLTTTMRLAMTRGAADPDVEDDAVVPPGRRRHPQR